LILLNLFKDKKKDEDKPIMRKKEPLNNKAIFFVLVKRYFAFEIKKTDKATNPNTVGIVNLDKNMLGEE